MNIIPSISSNSYITTSFLIGLLLSDGLTPAEQNSLGNWFMLIGQVLCSSSAQQQLLNNRSNLSNNYNSHIINDNNLKKDMEQLKKSVNNIFHSFK